MFVKIDWNPGERDLRKFGLTLLVLFPLFGLLLRWKTGWTPALCILGTLGPVVAFCSIFLPPVGRLMYKGWMGLAVAMATVISPIFMSVIFYGVMLPIGLVLRLLGKDAMQAKKPQGESFWLKPKHRTDVRSYGRQF